MLWVVCFDELDEDPYFPYNPSTFLSVLRFYISTFICINLWKWFGMFGIQRFHGDTTPKLSLYNSATHFSFDNKIGEFKEHINLSRGNVNAEDWMSEERPGNRR